MVLFIIEHKGRVRFAQNEVGPSEDVGTRMLVWHLRGSVSLKLKRALHQGQTWTGSQQHTRWQLTPESRSGTLRRVCGGRRALRAEMYTFLTLGGQEGWRSTPREDGDKKWKISKMPCHGRQGRQGSAEGSGQWGFTLMMVKEDKNQRACWV